MYGNENEYSYTKFAFGCLKISIERQHLYAQVEMRCIQCCVGSRVCVWYFSSQQHMQSGISSSFFRSFFSLFPFQIKSLHFHNERSVNIVFGIYYKIKCMYPGTSCSVLSHVKYYEWLWIYVSIAHKSWNRIWSMFVFSSLKTKNQCILNVPITWRNVHYFM